MRVCLDIQAALAQRAGGGRYTRMLAAHLPAALGADELRVACFDFQRRGVPFPLPGGAVRAVNWCPGRLAQLAWKTVGWPPYNWFAGRADVYHFPNFVLPPLTRGRSVVTIHDVSFRRFPEAAEPRNLRYLNAQIGRTVARADAIITDSAFSAREIVDLLGAPAEKVHAIPLGISQDQPRPAESEIALAGQMLKLERPYLLMVGTLEPRKNIPFLVSVFEQLRHFPGDLVIAGMRGWKYEPILARLQASPRRLRIRHLDYVDDSFLPALYAGAELLVFPSLYEGFGFPPLEAMAVQTPVISSAAGSLAEVLGDAAEVISGYDAREWAERIEALLDDSARRAALRARGLERGRQFTWAETARRTVAVYRALGA